jgi:hypothetical protein
MTRQNGNMNKLVLVMALSLYSSFSFSALNLNVKIHQIINDKVIEVERTISSDYNKEIIIQDDSLKDRIVLSLKKFKNVFANGKSIEPVQISAKLTDQLKKLKGKPQYVTSFYKKEATFKLGEEINQPELNLSLDFNEIN